MFYLDEIGTMPKIESLEMAFSAVRSRRYSIVAIIQSFALQKNYGKEGSEILLITARMAFLAGLHQTRVSGSAVKTYGKQDRIVRICQQRKE